jgi:hypothetical protein
MHTIRLPTIAFRLRNRFLLRQRFSNSSASSSARRKKKNRNVRRYPIYFSCGLFCLPPRVSPGMTPRWEFLPRERFYVSRLEVCTIRCIPKDRRRSLEIFQKFISIA